MKRALVILSGGQDSTTCLLMAIHKYKRENVSAISFIYNNKYRKDVECAKKVCKDFNISHEIYDIGVLQDLAGSNNFEGRNLILTSLAVIYAKNKKINNVIIGLAGNSIHPDCSEAFLNQLRKTIEVSIGNDVHIIAPLIKLDKSKIWEKADELGYLNYVKNNTFSCWDRQDMHCGKCLSCISRINGLEKYLRKE